MTRRPFRFAVSTSGIKERAPLAEHARTAESLGYSTLLIADHLLDYRQRITRLADKPTIFDTDIRQRHIGRTRSILRQISPAL